MILPRFIPCLLLKESALVKTTKFKSPAYIGDPINTSRIFNELEADELCILDITATDEEREPNYKLLAEIANECFMPLSYGGGINSLLQAEKLFSIGFEKIVLNSVINADPTVVKEIVAKFGSQAVVASVDVKKNFFGKFQVYSNSGKIRQKESLLDWIGFVEGLGVGEILLTNIDREGTWDGFDIDLISSVCSHTSLPVIAHGGAGSISDIKSAIEAGKASAVALGSMVVYQKKNMGVLVNFPERRKILENLRK